MISSSPHCQYELAAHAAAFGQPMRPWRLRQTERCGDS